MRVKIILMMLLALSFGSSEAVPVTRDQAERAARKWARGGHRLGHRHGTDVEKSSTFTNENGRTFHAVKLRGGGTVFTSSDTESEPIVAFTSSSHDFSALDQKSPLRALLMRDAEVRANIRALRASQGTPSSPSPMLLRSVTPAAPSQSPEAARWASLLADDEPGGGLRLMSAPPIQDDADLDDVRRAPLLETQWAQSTHNDDEYPIGLNYLLNWNGVDYPQTGTGIPCCNKYTPEFPHAYGFYTNDHVVCSNSYLMGSPCGCTATAMAQAMRYFRYPASAKENVPFLCFVEDVEKTNSYHSITLKTMGGAYDWDNMIAIPKNGVTEVQAAAIGKLTHDVSVSCRAMFGQAETGADQCATQEALTKYFGYANAVCITVNQQTIAEDANRGGGHVMTPIGLHDPNIRRRVILTNLDSRKPVLLSVVGLTEEGDKIDDNSGHSIVGDGYGYVHQMDDETQEVTDSVEYVHINMGWSGKDNAWYNIPEIDAKTTGATASSEGLFFTVMDCAVYNIFTNETGEIVSGRVLNDGVPVVGATVTAGKFSGVTDDKGIYSLIVPSNTNLTLTAFDQQGNRMGTTKVEVKESKNKHTEVGNVWGADINLAPFTYADSICLNNDSSKLYGTIEAAQAQAVDGDTLTLLAPTCIYQPDLTITKKLTITSVDGDPSATPIFVRWNNNGLTVATNAALTLKNVAFMGMPYSSVSNKVTHAVTFYDGDTKVVIPGLPSSQHDPNAITNITYVPELNPICVQANAKITVSGTLTLPSLVLNDADSFRLAGEIFSTLDLVVPSYVRGDSFGTTECDAETFARCAQFLPNRMNPNLCAERQTNKTLCWGLMSVSDEDLVATLRYADDGESVSRYSNFDDILTDFNNSSKDAQITLFKSCAMSNAVTVAAGRELKLDVAPGFTEENRPVISEIGPNAGFTLEDESRMILSNVIFDGYVGNALFLVNGENAELLSKGAQFKNLIGTNGWSGAITVLKGTVRLTDQTEISGCLARGGGRVRGYGGAVYLSGEGCTNILEAVLISNCVATASNGGGAIYAGTGSTVVLGKDTVHVCDNQSGATATEDDIYLNCSSLNRARLCVVGAPAHSAVGIRYNPMIASNVDQFGNAEGSYFAEFTGTGDENQKMRAALIFFNTLSDKMKGTYDAETTFYAWEVIPDGEYRTTPDPENDVARIVRTPVLSHYFNSLDEALEAVDEDNLEIEMFQSTTFADDLVIPYSLTLSSASDEAIVTLVRSGDYRIVVTNGVTLTLTDIQVSGGSASGITDVESQLIDVRGGSLVLGDGAVICDVDATGSRASGAVVVWEHGSLTMESGATIRACTNHYVNIGNKIGIGAGILVDNATATLNGGTITGCSAYRSAAVSVNNGGHLYVRGDVRITGNTTLDGKPSDLTIEDLQGLTLTDELDQSAFIGIEDGIQVDTNIFGRVSADYEGDVLDLTDSAARFYRNDNPAIRGCVVTNETQSLLVWSHAIKTDGEEQFYEDPEGKRYSLVGEIFLPPVTPPDPADPEPDPDQDPVVTNYPTPIAFVSIERLDPNLWRLVLTNRVSWCRYRLLSTDEITKGFTTTGEWVTAEGEAPQAWTNDIPTTTERFFWRAEGTWGIVPPLTISR